MYSNAGGVKWAAGTNALATRLRSATRHAATIAAHGPHPGGARRLPLFDRSGLRGDGALPPRRGTGRDRRQRRPWPRARQRRRARTRVAPCARARDSPSSRISAAALTRSSPSTSSADTCPTAPACGSRRAALHHRRGSRGLPGADAPSGSRTVSMAFSAFRVGVASTGERRPDAFRRRRLRRRRAAIARRGYCAMLDEFRRAAAASPAGGRAPCDRSAGGRGDRGGRERSGREPFTLLGGGVRWQQADGGQPIVWHRNTLMPSPIQGADTDDQMRIGPRAWTRSAECDDRARPSAALDPPDRDQLHRQDPTAPTAISAPACSRSAIRWTSYPSGPGHRRRLHRRRRTSSAARPSAPSRTASSSSTTTPRCTDSDGAEHHADLEHEIGHGIGLGHTDEDVDNIIYPSCCPTRCRCRRRSARTISPGWCSSIPGQCTFTVSTPSMTTTVGGGVGEVLVTASMPTCGWQPTSTELLEADWPGASRRQRAAAVHRRPALPRPPAA